MDLKEKSPIREKEEILAFLEREHAFWSPLYHRVLRSAGLDGQINREFTPVNDRMNGLLEELFEQNVVIEFGAKL